MVRNFEAEITLVVNNQQDKVVHIIPFYDKDKDIAKHLEELVNYTLLNDSDELEVLGMLL